MNFIEFTGMVGAGKSTVAVALATHLQQHQLNPLTPADASRRCLERSRCGQVIQALVPVAWQKQFLNRWLRHVTLPVYQFLFALAHPQLWWLVYQSQLKRQLPWGHRRLILQRFATVAGHYQFLCSRLKADEVVIFEEGLVHRAINLFAWEEGALKPEVLLAYYRQLPVMGLLIVVEAPDVVCQVRAQNRGLPARLAAQDALVIERFTHHSRHIIQLALAAAAGQRPVIQLDNSQALAESMALLHESLTRHGIGRKPPVGVSGC